MTGSKRCMQWYMYILFGIALFALSFFRTNYFVGIITAVIFFLYICFFCISNIKLVLKYLFLFFGIISYAVGNFFCDFFNIYLVELGTNSVYVGSFCLLALMYWFSTITLCIIDNVISRIILKKRNYKYLIDNLSITKSLKKYAPFAVFLLGLIYWLLVIRYPSFLLNENRFGYVGKYMPSWLNKIRTIPILISPIVFLSISHDGGKNDLKKIIKKIIIIYFPFFLFAFWIGNKFGMFLDIAVAFVIPFASIINYKKMKLKKIFEFGLMFISFFSILLVLFWGLRGNTIEQMGEKFIIRLSQQGELWWIEVARGDWNRVHFSDIWQEVFSIIRSCVTKGGEKTYGVYRLMQMYGNSSYLSSYYDVDMRLASQGFELSFYFFGILAFLLFPITSNVFYSIITNLYANAVNNRSFSAVVFLRILILLESAIMQGDWYRFLSILDIGLFSLLIIDIILRKTLKTSSNNRKEKAIL